MDPRYKKWQIYYVIQQLRGAAPEDDTITVLYRSFDLPPEFVDTHVRNFDRRGIIGIKETLKDRGYIIRLIKATKFEEEYEMAKKGNEERAFEYNLKHSGLKPYFETPGVLRIGSKRSIFDKDSQIYELCRYMVSGGLGKSYEAEDIWMYLNHNQEPTKKNIISVRHVVRNLNRKLQVDFKIKEDFFDYKGKQVVFRPEVLVKMKDAI